MLSLLVFAPLAFAGTPDCSRLDEVDRAFCEEEVRNAFRPIARCDESGSYWGGRVIRLLANQRGLALLETERLKGPDGDGESEELKTHRGILKEKTSLGARYVFHGHTLTLDASGAITAFDGAPTYCDK